MNKILSTCILFMCILLGANAQAVLPYESFSSDDFGNTALFPNNSSATWNDSDEGRINMPKGSSFTFKWDGTPGNLTFSSKSEKWVLSINGKYRLETSNDEGNSWVTVENSMNLGENYSDYSFALPMDVRMIRISSVTTSLIGTACYIKDLKLGEYDLSIDSVYIKYPDTKVLNTSTVSVPIKGKNLSGDITLELAQNSPHFSLPVTSITKDYVEDGEGTSFVVSFNPIELGIHKDTLLVKDENKNLLRIPLEGNAPSYQAYLNLESSFKEHTTEYLKETAAQKLNINVSHLVSNVSIKAPTHFEISLDSVHYFKTLNLDYKMLNSAVDTVLFVRLNTPYVGTFSEKLLFENTEAKLPLQEIELNGTVFKATPILKKAPTVDRNLNWGEALSALQFEGGEVANSKGETLKGTYRWVLNADFTPEIGTSTLLAYFVPEYSYGYETTECEVNIRVLKRLQTVTWNQEFDEMRIGDQVTLTAKSSSELPIIYEVSNPDVAKVENSKLTALAPGRISVVGGQPGNDFFDAAGGITYYITVLSPSGLSELALPKTSLFWSDRPAGVLSIRSEQAMNITVMDSQGKTVIAGLKTESSATITLPASSTSGLYFVRIVYQNGGNEVIKVIK